MTVANRLSQLLQQWYPQRDSTEWVLGTVYKTEGPCYRKAGAMMLFNGMGQQFGMLSGGCLESDIQQHARRVMQSGISDALRALQQTSIQYMALLGPVARRKTVLKASIIPIIGARSATQLQDNMSILDFNLPQEVISKLDDISAIELGFPHDFLNGVKESVYGETFELIENHRIG